MFLGTHAPRLDEKGRLILPAKYRDELAGGVVITKGQERCLYVFPQEEFARITEALRTAPVTAKSVRDYSRVFFAICATLIPLLSATPWLSSWFIPARHFPRQPSAAALHFPPPRPPLHPTAPTWHFSGGEAPIGAF